MDRDGVSSKNDLRPHFELTLSVPCDVRFAATIGSVVDQAARQAGCAPAAAGAFAKRVEACVRQSLEAHTSTDLLPVVVRHDDGPVEVLVNGHVLTPDA
jgi:hypothetical protein